MSATEQRPPVDDDAEPTVTVPERNEVRSAVDAADESELPAPPPRHPEDGREPELVYRYRHEAGELAYVVARYRDPKDFRPWTFAHGGWRPGYPPRRRPYRLPELRAALEADPNTRVWITEGEKDADAVEAAGGVATCSPGGSNGWHADDREGFAETLRAAGVWKAAIVAHRDPAGERYAQSVRAALGTCGIVDVEILQAAEDNDAADHLAAGHTLGELARLEPETPEEPHVTRPPQLVPLASFVESREEQAQALLGDDEDTFLARGGLGITGGVGGSTKTTLMIDAAAHLAAGIPWLGIPVPRPLRVALIENEGSRAKFRDKLRQKVDSWEGPAFAGNVLVLDEPWTAFSFADADHRQALRDQCVDAGVELVVANPLGNLGVDGVGSPEETEAFMRHLRDCGLDRDLAFWLIHHFNRGGHRDILHRLSGAWDRHADTIIGVEREGTRRTKLTWAKTRWATPPEDKATILEWHVPTRGFTVIETEQAEQLDDSTYEQRILDHLRDHAWITTDELHNDVQGRASEVRKARHRLETAGRITRAPSHKVGHPGRADRWNLAPEAGQSPVPLPGTGQDGSLAPPVTSDEPRPPVPTPVGGRDGRTDGVLEQAEHDEDEIERLLQ